MKSLNLFPENDFHNLYIIGNGFDRSHGLKSGYGDFGGWLVAHHPVDALLLGEFLLNDKKEMLWCSFEEALGKFDMDEIKNNDLQNLFVITYIDDDGNKNVTVPSVADPNIFERLGNHFSDWAKDINIELCSVSPKYVFPDDSLFLTFNYTDTLESVYKIIEGRVRHLNGRAAKDSSVIIGHDRDINPFDAYFGNQSNIRKENNGFQQLSEYADLRKDGNEQVEKAIVNAFKEAISTIRDVTIIGHSYGKVDYSYFQTIISYLPNNVTWHLGYHTEEDNNRLNSFVDKFMLKDYKAFMC